MVVVTAFFLITYAVLELGQVAWLYVEGFASTSGVAWTAARAIATGTVTLAVVRLHRWAWWLAAVLSGLLGLVTIVGLGALIAGSLLAPGIIGGELAFLDPITKLLIATSVLCLVAAFAMLLVGLSRDVPSAPEAIIRTPMRLLSVILLIVLLAAGALWIKAVRDPNLANVSVLGVA